MIILKDKATGLFFAGFKVKLGPLRQEIHWDAKLAVIIPDDEIAATAFDMKSTGYNGTTLILQVHDKTQAQIDAAIELAVQYGGIDGDHHKMWVIDQIVRTLAGDRYEQIVRDAKAGEDGPETYSWDEGIAP